MAGKHAVPTMTLVPGFARREFLQASAGSLGILGSSLSTACANPAPGRAVAKSVIMIFNCGAPSHIDLWDPKPLAADDVRSPFSVIDTCVPGIQVTELLPEMAKRADRLAILRTLHHKHGGHNSGMHWSIVGQPYREDSTLINPSPADIPSFGTLIGWLAQRGGFSGSAPPYVITPAPHCDSTVYLTPGQFGGCLGVRYDPFVLNADPNVPDFRVKNLQLPAEVNAERVEMRRNLLHSLDQRGRLVPSSTADEMTSRLEQALQMVRTGDAARAFDLSLEPDAIRERYGRHSWGQSHLLARRLVEHGTRFVATVNGPSITWDTHKDNFNQLQKRLVPPMEKAFAALLDDLESRGLLDTTLVIWMGDFGRTPKINKDVGRDHWPSCYTMVLAGGGIQGGQVVGESDQTGSYPRSHPLTPADVHATVFRALGYEAREITYHSADGRPIPLSSGTPIREILPGFA